MNSKARDIQSEEPGNCRALSVMSYLPQQQYRSAVGFGQQIGYPLLQ